MQMKQFYDIYSFSLQGEKLRVLEMRNAELWSIVVTRTNDAMDQTLVHLRMMDQSDLPYLLEIGWRTEFSSPSLYKDQYQLCTCMTIYDISNSRNFSPCKLNE